MDGAVFGVPWGLGRGLRLWVIRRTIPPSRGRQEGQRFSRSTIFPFALPGGYPDRVFQFYKGVLAWSTDLNLVALLDQYVAPTPVVTELVRGQLLRIDQVEAIREAIRARIHGETLIENRYFEWLSHSGLNFRELTPELLSVFNRSVLHRALFDLQLGQAVKSEKVNRYREVGELRSAIEDFMCNSGAVSVPDLLGIWWDRAGLQETGNRSWVKDAVKREPRFVTLVQAWIDDSREVQEWLDAFESMTAVVNNPSGSVDCRTFSESTAVAVVKFTQVRRLNGPITATAC